MLSRLRSRLCCVALGIVAVTFAPATAQADTTPPQTTITAGPTGHTSDDTPAFSFTSDEPGSSFKCSVDGGAFAVCDSPHTLSPQDDGSHTFEVRAEDAAGNVDLSPDRAEFVVGSDAPAGGGGTYENGRIAYTSNRTGEFKIHASDPSGLQTTQLTFFSGNDFGPAYSPDGQKIAYWTPTIVDTINADGSNQQTLTNGQSPAYSPDGSRIAYVFFGDIHDVALDGTDDRMLTFGDDEFPTYGPDGRIYFQRPIAGNAEIMRMDAAGSNVVRLTTSTAQELDPTVGPDGRVFFSSDRDGDQELFVMDPDGSNQIQLTHNQSADYQPTVSPDGKRVAFRTTRDGNDEIYIMDVNGKNQHALAVSPTSVEGDPSWQPLDTVTPTPSLDTPANGSTTADTTPNLAGDAGTARFDAASVTVKLYTGSTATGTPIQTLNAPVSNGSYDTTAATLPNGTYTAQAEQSDSSGNVGRSAERTFTVDTPPADATPPQTTITDHPSDPTADHTPTFRFSSDEQRATFECKLDGGPFSPCDSPHTTASLDDGSHTFHVRAKDAAGNIDPSADSFSFSVETPGPADAVIRGTPGNDRLVGTPGNDVIVCGEGDDRVIAGAGNDFVDCAGGDDSISAGTGDDRILGGRGNDVIRGGSGEDRLRGQSGDDHITGGNGDDDLEAGDGDDRLLGGNGNDRVRGERGQDQLRGGAGNDRLRGGRDDDDIAGNNGDDDLDGDDGDDRLRGGNGHDRLRGGADDDHLRGGFGDDTLFGGPGVDLLDGGRGRDSIDSDPGEDRILRH